MQKYRGVVWTDEEHTRMEGEQQTLGNAWGRFSASIDLIHIKTVVDFYPDEASLRIWDIQDGYGAAGFTPSQGYDWSGIRDSTPEAVAEMWDVAQEFLPLPLMLAILGLDE